MRTRMRRLGARVALVSGPLLAGCGPTAPPPFTEAHRAAIQDSVLQLLGEFTEMVNDGDLAGMLGVYADDPAFHWVENGGIAYPSYAALVRTFEVLEGTLAELRLSIENPRVLPLAPGVASVTSSYRQFFADTTGAEFDVQGAMTITVVHRPEGWRFLTGHASQLPGRGR